jgi:hypothetical protein
VLLTPKLHRGTPYLLGLASSSSTEPRVRAAISPTRPLGKVTIEFSYAVFATVDFPPPTMPTTTTAGN